LPLQFSFCFCFRPARAHSAKRTIPRQCLRSFLGAIHMIEAHTLAASAGWEADWPDPARSNPVGCRIGSAELKLSRRGVAVELAADRLLLPAETRRILLQQIALGADQAGGIILPHLLLDRTGCWRRQRQAGVDGVELQARLHPAAAR